MLLGHEVALQTQALPPQSGVAPEQVVQPAPHFCAVLQNEQLLALQYEPAPHCPSLVHCTQVVPPLQTDPAALQSVHDEPQ